MHSSRDPETASQRDRTFELLSSERRRLAMRVLCDESMPCDLGTLARKVAACEQGVRSDDVTRAERDTVAASLHHAHLPKLDARDVVTYDAENNEIVASAVAERLRNTAGVTSALANVED